MDWTNLADWLESTWIHDQVIDKFWLFPVMETVHFMGLTVLFGSLLVVDLRVLGLCKFINMKASMKYIPLAIGAFCVNLLSGFVFLCADPYRYLPNIAFQWKMGMLIIAGFNALWFWFGEHKELQELADGEDAEFRAKVIAFVSLVLWVAIIICGRFMPYVE